MGYYKYLTTNFLNKRHFYVLKMYSYYRKDIWGQLRVKRLFKYKKVLYNILKRKRRFYNIMLYSVYKGVKFMNKNYTYKANLMFMKKCLKLFYGFIRDSYFGKLGLFVKRSMGDVVNYFYSLLERRIDVLVYRSLYSLTIRHSRLFTFRRVLTINDDIFIYDPKTVLKVGEFLTLSARPFNFLFNQLGSDKSIETYKYRKYLYFLVRSIFLDWEDFEPQRELFELFVKMSFPKHKGFESEILQLIYLFISRFYIFFILMLRAFSKKLKKRNKKVLFYRFCSKKLSMTKEQVLFKKHKLVRVKKEDEQQIFLRKLREFENRGKKKWRVTKDKFSVIMFNLNKIRNKKKTRGKNFMTVREFFYEKITDQLSGFLTMFQGSPDFKGQKILRKLSSKILRKYMILKYVLFRRLIFLYKKKNY